MITQGLASKGAKVYITGRRDDVCVLISCFNVDLTIAQVLKQSADSYKGPKGSVIPYVIMHNTTKIWISLH